MTGPLHKALGRVPAGTMGWRIRQARIKAGLTQRALADRIGLSKSFISLLEVGRTAPSVETVRMLADVLRCRLDYLIAGRGRKHR